MVIGVSVRAGRCRLVAAGADPRATFDRQDSFTTPARPATLVRAVADRIARITADESRRRLLGVGIVLPWAVDPRTGRVVDPDAPHAFGGCDLPALLADRTGAPVRVEHETAGLCRAERWFNLDMPLRHFAVINASDGVSIRVCCNGQTMGSPLGRCGRLGSLPIHPDHHDGNGDAPRLADAAGDTALARAVSLATGATLDPEHAARHVRRIIDAGDDGHFQPLLERIADHLAYAVAAATVLFDPEALFIHGRVLDARPDMLQRIAHRAAAMGDARPVHRCRAQPEHGAVACVVDHLIAHDAR